MHAGNDIHWQVIRSWSQVSAPTANIMAFEAFARVMHVRLSSQNQYFTSDLSDSIRPKEGLRSYPSVLGRRFPSLRLVLTSKMMLPCSSTASQFPLSGLQQAITGFLAGMPFLPLSLAPL